HAFFSPYALLVALVAKITNVDAIRALQYVAYFNLVLLFTTYYLFCKSIFKNEVVATTGLIFILFLWGRNPFLWSGFYHIYGLGNVLPYPSTFALSLAFLVLYLLSNNPGKKTYVKSAVMVMLSSVVFITHPTTAIFLFAIIVAYNFCFNDYSIKQTIITSS